jgi:hypothetical protein
MSPISRGFHGRRREADPGRVPPGQYVTKDFPVLSAGPTPHTALANWIFSIEGGHEPKRWTWADFQALQYLGTVQFGGRGDDQVRDRAPVTIAAMLGKQPLDLQRPVRQDSLGPACVVSDLGVSPDGNAGRECSGRRAAGAGC